MTDDQFPFRPDDANHHVPRPLLAGHPRQPGHFPRRTPPLRKYEVAYLSPGGHGRSVVRLAPATRLFEEPFVAFARGTLISIPGGTRAIEDLRPGDQVLTVDAGPVAVQWTGATTLVPGSPGASTRSTQLIRVPADALGPGRPTQDLLLGFGARLYRAARDVMTPAAALVDGESIVTVTPPSPVRLFHLALTRHSRIRASGVDVESFHPGSGTAALGRPELAALYATLFPHVSALGDFGPLMFARTPEPRPSDAA